MHFWITVAAGFTAVVATIAFLNLMFRDHPEDKQAVALAGAIGSLNTLCAVCVFLYLLYQ